MRIRSQERRLSDQGLRIRLTQSARQSCSGPATRNHRRHRERSRPDVELKDRAEEVDRSQIGKAIQSLKTVSLWTWSGIARPIGLRIVPRCRLTVGFALAAMSLCPPSFHHRAVGR